MRYALILLPCALVISSETFCLGQQPPPQAQVQPKKPGFFQRLFHRSGNTSADEEAGMGEGDMNSDGHYNPYGSNTPAIPAAKPVPDSTTNDVFPVPERPKILGGKDEKIPGPKFGEINLNPRSLLGKLWVEKLHFRSITFKRPKNQDEVASVHLCFLGVRPWVDLKSDLEAKFSLDANTALTKVVPIVGADSVSVLEVNNSALRLSGPASGRAPALSNAPGTPTSLIPADPTTALTPLSTLTNRSSAISLDPFLQYRAAQSLLQNVTLLNNTIKNAPLNKLYDAYVVSLQVTLMPYRRDQPYDVYTDITFVVLHDF